MGALDEGHYHVVLENGFETLTGDVNKEGLGKSPLCVGKALSEGTRVTDWSTQAGKRWPNFITVDFYKLLHLKKLIKILQRSSGGPPAAVDMANGKSVCGCNTIVACRIMLFM
ncbi:hypothetical protein L1987_15179 [Smallanthus sonchifolius]|uniref:Uncharacterized protein n=1 Tax=Smallanthus sonchifolius TaxID=185202 RepID=A0ACB9J758_9ASTR|nr:hypothetical protein L1987_15179 [Smallanthus sonchifolius]